MLMTKQFILGLVLYIAMISVHAEGWSSANPERFDKTSFDKAIWHENFTRKDLPCTIEYCNGAQGKVERIAGDTPGHTVSAYSQE